eukprot:COSAG01_NODE_5367_length_4305_cov_60.283642_4_plen_86_part_00
MRHPRIQSLPNASTLLLLLLLLCQANDRTCKELEHTVQGHAAAGACHRTVTRLAGGAFVSWVGRFCQLGGATVLVLTPVLGRFWR